MQRIQSIDKRFTFELIEGGGFAYHHRRVNRILVTGVSARQVAVALLKAYLKTVGFTFFFKLSDIFAYILEAGKHFNDLRAVMLGNKRRHVGGNYRLYYNRLFAERTGIFLL